MPRGCKPERERALSNAERQARCHVRLQGVETQDSSRLSSSRLIVLLMQACAVGGGH
jgi:hypothetical protein